MERQAPQPPTLTMTMLLELELLGLGNRGLQALAGSLQAQRRLVQVLQAARLVGRRAAPAPQPSPQLLEQLLHQPMTSLASAAWACGCRSSLQAMTRWARPRCTCSWPRAGT